MPLIDTPITTDATGLKRVMAQGKAVLLLLHDGRRDEPLSDALNKAARKHSGDLLVTRIDVSEHPQLHAEHGKIGLPALVSYDARGKQLGKSDYVRPADVRQHVALLISGTPLPQTTEKTSKAAASTSHSATAAPITVTDANWRNEVLKSKVPVLVDFWAPWCGPCRSIAPFVEQMAKQYAGQLKVVKLNTDENPVMSRRYAIQSIPTFAIFQGGQQVARISGANPGGIKRLIDQVL